MYTHTHTLRLRRRTVRWEQLVAAAAVGRRSGPSGTHSGDSLTKEDKIKSVFIFNQ